MGQHFRNVRITARIAEKDQISRPNIVGSHVRVVFDREFTAKVVMPFVGESLQAGGGVSLHGCVPRSPSATHAKKRRRERVVNRALQTGAFACERRFANFARDGPRFVSTNDDDSFGLGGDSWRHYKFRRADT